MLSVSEVQQKIGHALQELGLTEHEVNLYVLSLLQGPSSVANLAKTMGVTRTNLYKVIAGLERQGLVKVGEGKRHFRHFSVEAPTVVLERLRQKRERMSAIDGEVVGAMPDLLAMYKRADRPMAVQVFQGKESFRSLFFRMIEEVKDEIAFFGSSDDFTAFFPSEDGANWRDARVRRGIFLRILALPGNAIDVLKDTNQAELREVRVVRDIDPFVGSMTFFANKTVIWQPQNAMAVLVEDRFLSGMLRSVFHRLWTDSAPRP